MAVKIYVLFTMLLFAGVVPPLAHAQLGIIGGILTGRVNVSGVVSSGVVSCGVGNSINLSTNSVFPNATVQLRCNNNVVSSTTTDATGAFTIIAALSTALLSNLPGNCNVFVAIPLVTCNASLPSTGNLMAQLEGVFTSILGITNLVAENFSLQQTIT